MQIMNLVEDLRPVILAARQYSDDRHTLAQFLPNVSVQALSYRLGRTQRLDQVVPVRAFGSPAIPIRRPGVVEVRGDLPAITPRVDFSELDLNWEFIMAQQLAGQQVDWSPWVNAGAGLVAATVNNTLEVMRGQALSTGAVSLVAEDGAVHEVDYGLEGEQKITASGGDFLASLLEAHEVYEDVAGESAGVALTSKRIIRRALAAFQARFPNQQAGYVNLNGWLADNGLPEFFANDRTLRDDETATRERIYPQDCLTFLPSAPIGRTELGVTQEAIQQVQNRVLAASEVAGLTIVTLGQDDPVERAVKGAAVGLPVIQDNTDIVILSGLLADNPPDDGNGEGEDGDGEGESE